MGRTKKGSTISGTPAVSCAIYTRKSTEEGLEQEFNTLDAQRESGEAYIKSQEHEGWSCLPDRYDDGGFTGGNMDRPALRQLLRDIESERINCVVVYKVDRLSRSLLDFARIMETFERYNVSFVSVTQQFNTGTSMGRLILNVLLSFAQFEREMISERTRDKIAAARRKGKWVGGHPLLGYDVDPNGFRLVVNEEEAVQVRALFDLYLKHESLLPAVRELDDRGWMNKRWTTRQGHTRGGKPFTRNSLYKLLTNVTYLGRVKYKSETHEGEHAAIVDAEVWQRVQSILQRNGRTGGALVRNKYGALLKGLLRCVPCDCAMTPTHSTRNGTTRYRYYVCANAQRRGWNSCPSKSIPAGEIERFVVDQLKGIGNDPALLDETITQTQEQIRARTAELHAERRGLEHNLRRWNDEIRMHANQLASGASDTVAVSRLAELHEWIRESQRRVAVIQEQAVALDRQPLRDSDVAQALRSFDPLWESLTPFEKSNLMRLLVQRVDYDGMKGKLSIAFHASGIQTLTEMAARRTPGVTA